MSIDFNNYRLEDGTVSKLCIENAEVRVTIRNWREDIDVLVFDDVIGMESFSFVNSSLSHAEATETDPFLVRSCMTGEESQSRFQCFRFYSAWSPTPILKIIARSFRVESSQIA